MGWVHVLNAWLGLKVEARELTVGQVALRGVIVFVAALIMLRLADRRFLAKLSAFDALLALVLASVLARAINGSAAFFPTIVVGFLLVGLHRLVGWLAFTFKAVGKVVKGKPKVLVRDGTPLTTTMRANNISNSDLLEEVRLNGQVNDLQDVRTATLERNGEISVIPNK